jgi:8-amino-7-oxononanoate synthase
VIKIRDELRGRGYAVGGIRQPTVERAIIRLIARVGESSEDLRELCRILKKLKI